MPKSPQNATRCAAGIAIGTQHRKEAVASSASAALGAMPSTRCPGTTRIAALPTGAWLWWGIGLFVVGWAIQFVGHVYEGRKPAFVDDLVGLVIGPLFVVAEAVFALGLRRDLHAAIEQRAGPVRQRAPAGRGAARS